MYKIKEFSVFEDEVFIFFLIFNSYPDKFTFQLITVNRSNIYRDTFAFIHCFLFPANFPPVVILNIIYTDGTEVEECHTLPKQFTEISPNSHKLFCNLKLSESSVHTGGDCAE